MKYPSQLIPGILVKRYKRFLADIVLDSGEEITAHCANPGSMMNVAIEGSKIWVSRSPNKARKLPYSWELIDLEDTLLAINTSNPNKIAYEEVEAGNIPELRGYNSIRREVRYGENSRIDLLLEEEGEPSCYVEVKNVHLSRESGLAEFPDSVTARGAKHMRELAKVAGEGHRAILLYVVQRGDCTRFSPAADIDPAYALALGEAKDAGVDLLCYDCEINTQEIQLRRPLPIEF